MAANIEQQLMDDLERELVDIGLELEALVTDYFDKNNISDTGDLRKSITSEVTRELDGIRLTFGTNMQYAVFVHEGTRPHFPPEKPIRQWVVRKLGISGDAVPKVTQAIRWKIAKEGTEAKPFLAVPWRAYRNVMAQRIIKVLKKNLTN